jgi:hypothetical protein
VKHGTWLAYCDRRRLLPLDGLGRRLDANPELTPRLDPAAGVLVVTVHDRLTGNIADVAISIDLGTHVPQEAAELAERLTSREIGVDAGVPMPDPKVLARADARYELTWELRWSDETYNAMMEMADILLKECDAIVFDSTNDRFV